MKSGDIQVFVSNSEDPNSERNDFMQSDFCFPMKIHYEKHDVKEKLFLNFFSKK